MRLRLLFSAALLLINAGSSLAESIVASFNIDVNGAQTTSIGSTTLTLNANGTITANVSAGTGGVWFFAFNVVGGSVGVVVTGLPPGYAAAVQQTPNVLEFGSDFGIFNAAVFNFGVFPLPNPLQPNLTFTLNKPGGFTSISQVISLSSVGTRCPSLLNCFPTIQADFALGTAVTDASGNFVSSQQAAANAAASLGDLAAARARSLLGKPYFEGGKGYNMATKNNNPPFPYVDVDSVSGTPSISIGYLHCALVGGATVCPSPTNTVDIYPDLEAAGIDCSGLVFWSYNTAAGALTTDTAQNPLPRATDEGAGDQYVNSTLADPANLKPGDLLFFDYHHPTKDVDHVAMYVGNSGVVEAYYPGWGVLPSSLIPDGQGHTRANYDPFLEKVDLPQCIRNPKSAIGWSNVPCFVGYRTPMLSPKYSILFGLHSPATLSVTDPDGISITPDTFFITDRETLREVPGELYYTIDSSGDDEVIGRILKNGNYFIQVIPKPDASSSDTYSLTVTAAGSTITLAENVPISQIPALGYGVQSDGSAIVPFIPVAIDIKPGSTRNPINPKSKGKIPVGILSSPTFNALSEVYVNSLTFGRTGAESSLAFCNSGGEDVNGDGLLDLVCHFYTQKTGFQDGDTHGVLQGLTGDGKLIRGTDSVVIVP